MADTPQTPKKTLTIGGGTLSVGSSPAPRGGGSVSVEVRRRRFDAPSALNSNVPSATTATSEEMQRRLAALQASQDSEKTKQNDMQEALRRASQLQEDRVKQASQKAQAEEEARKAAQEAAKAAAQERTANRAGSGAGSRAW